MTVKELIEKLEAYPHDAQVMFADNDGGVFEIEMVYDWFSQQRNRTEVIVS